MTQWGDEEWGEGVLEKCSSESLHLVPQLPRSCMAGEMGTANVKTKWLAYGLKQQHDSTPMNINN